MRPGEAVMELSRIGFQFRMEGESIKLKFEGDKAPDPVQVAPLLEVARQHRDEVRYFLKSYCPKCGGCCFVPDYGGRPLCLGCAWPVLVERYPGLAGVKH
jgi:hypothetical protein